MPDETIRELAAAAIDVAAAAQRMSKAVAAVQAAASIAAELEDLSREGFFSGAVLTVEDGLSRAESLTVATLRAANGRVIAYGALAACCSPGNLADGGPDPRVVSVRLNAIKRKRRDLWEQIDVVHGTGLRWRVNGPATRPGYRT